MKIGDIVVLKGRWPATGILLEFHDAIEPKVKTAAIYCFEEEAFVRVVFSGLLVKKVFA